ncbi:single-stranded-DNA-specific exonuclease RecJ [Candidatus Roizmanbacteria bacterium]|nr:single-stranded-DNA-specific exonuclease RecJ [Candidatus Roizmanbacteria bacterium]
MKITFKREIKEKDRIDTKKFIQLLLKNRNIKDEKEFLHPTHPAKITLSDFGLKKQIQKTLKILKEIKKTEGTVVVYTDYDADGITGGAIVWETLHLLGFKAMPYVPHRKKEGYGFSKAGIDAVKKQFNPSLIISVDHGITARDKVSYAKKLGIPIIITDHHLKPERLPDEAEAIFHIPALSGSGVGYFFAKQIFEEFKTSAKHPHILSENFNSDYLSFASIGTIADMVSLTGPSRSIAKYGLDTFQTTKRCGLLEIMKDAGINGRRITPYEVGFMIAPRINAVGRLEHAIDSLRLLCTTKVELAHYLASRIGEKNRLRQDMVKVSVEEARLRLKASTGKQKIIILSSETWHEGIIGLIASKLVEAFYRPAIIITKSEGFYKGSARSIPALHMTNFLRELKDYLIDVGGHAQAAGFSINKEKLDAFVEKAQKKAEKMLKNKDLEKVVTADAKIPLAKISLGLVKELENLQPFGIGNPQPTFYSETEVLYAKIISKNQDHLKIYLKDPNSNGFPIEFIAFSAAKEFYKLSRGQKINVVYSLYIDRWGGGEKLRGRIIHFQII